jgi:hypothetical protein
LTTLYVDVIAYNERGFREPWYLVVPVDSAALWRPAEIVAPYRERMQIEQSFRDFKTHLGLRGLRLQVRVAERMGRLLLAFCLTYALLSCSWGRHPKARRRARIWRCPDGTPATGPPGPRACSPLRA